MPELDLEKPGKLVATAENAKDYLSRTPGARSAPTAPHANEIKEKVTPARAVVVGTSKPNSPKPEERLAAVAEVKLKRKPPTNCVLLLHARGGRIIDASPHRQGRSGCAANRVLGELRAADERVRRLTPGP